MSLFIPRAVWRQPSKQLPGIIRFESSSSTATAKASEAAKNTASKAQESASNLQSKASQGLSRVTSAGPELSRPVKGVGNVLSKVGGRTGRLIAFVERQIPPTFYYAKVGMELSKMVFNGQKMAPPPLSAFQSYFQRLAKNIRNPSAILSEASIPTNPTHALDRMRNMSRAQWRAGGVVAAEMLGFFTVGEMIGRFKLVGYRGDTGADH